MRLRNCRIFIFRRPKRVPGGLFGLERMHGGFIGWGRRGLMGFCRRQACGGVEIGMRLLVLHPTGTDVAAEKRRATMVLHAVRRIGFDHTVIVYPNNDPGSGGIIDYWKLHTDRKRETVLRDVARGEYLALMRDAAVLVGNSSSGIIEAASFGTPVLDIGPRQAGRERSGNVKNVPFTSAAIERQLRRIWNGGRPRRFAKRNVYGGGGAGRRIAKLLASVSLDGRMKRKLIAYRSCRVFRSGSIWRAYPARRV